MAKPNRQELVARISAKVTELEREREGLLKQQASIGDRLRLVEGMLAEYQELLSPRQKAKQSAVTANAGSRTAARLERKQAMIEFLKDRGEAQTAEIIEAMQEALPHARPTRAQVQDVLQNEQEFASSKKGVWGLAPGAIPNGAIKPTAFAATVKRAVARVQAAQEEVDELFG